MKKYTVLFLVVSTLLFLSCDKAANFADNYTFGSYIKYKDKAAQNAAAVTALFDYNALENAQFSVDVETIGEPTKIEIYWQVTSKEEVLVKEIPLNPTNITVSALEIVKAKKPSATEASDLQEYISLGKSFTLVVYTYQGDKKLQTESELQGGPGFIALNTINISMVCPFVADDIVGRYVVEKDAWADVKVNDEVDVIKISDILIAIVGYPKPTSNQRSDTTFINIAEKDAPSGTATIGKTLDFGGYGSATTYSILSGKGTVFSCIGRIDVRIDFHDQPAGSPGFEGNRFIINKKAP